MENVHIYLAGGMSGLSLEEQIKWRNQVINAIRYEDYEFDKTPIFFNPPNYYSPSTSAHKSEKEVMEFELSHLRKSDLIVVNFNVPESIGTAMEIAVAKENRIPIIGLCKNEKDIIIHPWLTECCSRMFNNMREMVDYIVNYYLK